MSEGVEKMLETLYPLQRLSRKEAEKKFMLEIRPTSVIHLLNRPLRDLPDKSFFVGRRRLGYAGGRRTRPQRVLSPTVADFFSKGASGVFFCSKAI